MHSIFCCISHGRWRQHLVNHSPAFSRGPPSRGGQPHASCRPALAWGHSCSPSPSHQPLNLSKNFNSVLPLCRKRDWRCLTHQPMKECSPGTQKGMPSWDLALELHATGGEAGAHPRLKPKGATLLRRGPIISAPVSE